MSPTRRLVIGFIVLMAAAGGYALGRVLLRPSRNVVQPVAFNHQLHVGELEIECDLCHQHVRTGRHAGLPTLDVCADCHSEALTEDPEEQKLLELVAGEEASEFRKLFRIADHTLYSHRRHVVDAELPCETCHGEIADTTEPPETPLVRISMDLCVGCHEQNELSTDCTRCHR